MRINNSEYDIPVSSAQPDSLRLEVTNRVHENYYSLALCLHRFALDLDVAIIRTQSLSQ